MLEDKKNSKVTIFALFLASIVYFLLVVGGIFPYPSEDIEKGLAKGGMLFVTMLIFSFISFGRTTAERFSNILFVGLIAALIFLFRAKNFSFALEKIDGAILCPFVVAMILSKGYERFGSDTFISAFLVLAIIILIATLIYKMHFGFYDREVRFFLNGPIVYGWLMGLCGIFAFHLWYSGRRTAYGIVFVIFVIALFWTDSKGPLIAFFVAFIWYILLSLKRVKLRAYFLAAAALSIFYMFSDLLVAIISETRYSGLMRFFSNELTAEDDGSIGVRKYLISTAISNFIDNPLFGIGIGNFEFQEIVYPHNQHLELFAELGIFVGLLHIFFIVFAWIRADTLHRSIIILFFVAGSFSGDSSYLRFIYAFSLIMYLPASNHLSKEPLQKSISEK